MTDTKGPPRELVERFVAHMNAHGWSFRSEFSVVQKAAAFAQQETADLLAKLERLDGVFLERLDGVFQDNAELRGRIVALEQRAEQAERERDEAQRREYDQNEAASFLLREGYKRCNIPACNCGSWHRPEGEGS